MAHREVGERTPLATLSLGKFQQRQATESASLIPSQSPAKAMDPRPDSELVPRENIHTPQRSARVFSTGLTPMSAGGSEDASSDQTALDDGDSLDAKEKETASAAPKTPARAAIRRIMDTPLTGDNFVEDIELFTDRLPFSPTLADDDASQQQAETDPEDVNQQEAHSASAVARSVAGLSPMSPDHSRDEIHDDAHVPGLTPEPTSALRGLSPMPASAPAKNASKLDHLTPMSVHSADVAHAPGFTPEPTSALRGLSPMAVSAPAKNTSKLDHLTPMSVHSADVAHVPGMSPELTSAPAKKTKTGLTPLSVHSQDTARLPGLTPEPTDVHGLTPMTADRDTVLPAATHAEEDHEPTARSLDFSSPLTSTPAKRSAASPDFSSFPSLSDRKLASPQDSPEQHPAPFHAAASPGDGQDLALMSIAVNELTDDQEQTKRENVALKKQLAESRKAETDLLQQIATNERKHQQKIEALAQTTRALEAKSNGASSEVAPDEESQRQQIDKLRSEKAADQQRFLRREQELAQQQDAAQQRFSAAESELRSRLSAETDRHSQAEAQLRQSLGTDKSGALANLRQELDLQRTSELDTAEQKHKQAFAAETERARGFETRLSELTQTTSRAADEAKETLSRELGKQKQQLDLQHTSELEAAQQRFSATETALRSKLSAETERHSQAEAELRRTLDSDKDAKLSELRSELNQQRTSELEAAEQRHKQALAAETQRASSFENRLSELTRTTSQAADDAKETLRRELENQKQQLDQQRESELAAARQTFSATESELRSRLSAETDRHSQAEAQLRRTLDSDKDAKLSELRSELNQQRTSELEAAEQRHKQALAAETQRASSFENRLSELTRTTSQAADDAKETLRRELENQKQQLDQQRESELAAARQTFSATESELRSRLSAETDRHSQAEAQLRQSLGTDKSGALANLRQELDLQRTSELDTAEQKHKQAFAAETERARGFETRLSELTQTTSRAADEAKETLSRELGKQKQQLDQQRTSELEAAEQRHKQALAAETQRASSFERELSKLRQSNSETIQELQETNAQIRQTLAQAVEKEARRASEEQAALQQGPQTQPLKHISPDRETGKGSAANSVVVARRLPMIPRKPIKKPVVQPANGSSILDLLRNLGYEDNLKEALEQLKAVKFIFNKQIGFQQRLSDQQIPFLQFASATLSLSDDVLNTSISDEEKLAYAKYHTQLLALLIIKMSQNPRDTAALEADRRLPEFAKGNYFDRSGSVVNKQLPVDALIAPNTQWTWREVLCAVVFCISLAFLAYAAIKLGALAFISHKLFAGVTATPDIVYYTDMVTKAAVGTACAIAYGTDRFFSRPAPQNTQARPKDEEFKKLIPNKPVRSH